MVPADSRGLRLLPAPERRLLQLIFDHFAATAEWPLVDQLQHALDKTGDELDVAALAGEIDRVLGNVDAVGHQGRASLTIHGISLCSGSEPLLDDLLCLVRLEYERYLSDGAGATITSEEVAAHCDMDAPRLRRARVLIERLPGWQSISDGPDGSWSLQINREARRFKGVKSLDRLLATVPLPGYPAAAWPFVPASPTPQVATSSRSVFISCGEIHKRTLAYPLRDPLEANGVQAFIVSDLPRRGSA